MPFQVLRAVFSDMPPSEPPLLSLSRPFIDLTHRTHLTVSFVPFDAALFSTLEFPRTEPVSCRLQAHHPTTSHSTSPAQFHYLRRASHPAGCGSSSEEAKQAAKVQKELDEMNEIENVSGDIVYPLLPRTSVRPRGFRRQRSRRARDARHGHHGVTMHK